MKKLAIFGSTGSIGTQALEVVSEFPDLFKIEALSADNNWKLLAEQAIRFNPSTVAIADSDAFNALRKAVPKHIEVVAGLSSITEIAHYPSIDTVLNAIVGFAGLLPTIHAAKAGKNIALANKESLVIGGEFIMQLTRESKSQITPIDSEHAAIFQCLQGEANNTVEKVYLTASGGPFLDYPLNKLKQVSVADALKHPSWKMGKKISIDSATMLNKGFEMIGAQWLFNLKPNQLEVLIHPQSVVHSMVQFTDGSIKAQLGPTDMRLPILYALSYPNRLSTSYNRLNFLDYPELEFSKPNMALFQNLQLAIEAMKKGGNMPLVLNAANEVAVNAFLQERIKFSEIAHINETILAKTSYLSQPAPEDYILLHREAVKMALALIG